jgi:hypothetical protein
MPDDASPEQKIALLNRLLKNIDEAAQTCREVGSICQQSEQFLELALWYSEHAIREMGYQCSRQAEHQHQTEQYDCAACRKYADLRARAITLGRKLATER